MIYKNCLNCGQPIKADTHTQHQLFCSSTCQRQFQKKPKQERERIKQENFIPISFTCSYCGREIVVESPEDKRTRFCCKECEKKYWRHPPYEKDTTYTNFHSVEEYLSYEIKLKLEGDD